MLVEHGNDSECLVIARFRDVHLAYGSVDIAIQEVERPGEIRCVLLDPRMGAFGLPQAQPGVAAQRVEVRDDPFALGNLALGKTAPVEIEKRQRLTRIPAAHEVFALDADGGELDGRQKPPNCLPG